LAEAHSESALLELLEFAEEKSIPVTILGGGSNVLVSDEGVKGLVIVNQIKGREYREEGDEVFVTVGAGEVFDRFVEETVAKNYWGLENLSHIPGSVGAVPVQNVGAYGVEVSNVIKKVFAVNKTTKTKKEFTNEECNFAYRDSFFKTDEGREWVIVSVGFLLRKNPTPTLEYKDLQSLHNPTQQEIRDKVIEVRAGKFPDWNKVGTAGSFFKNPIISKEHFMELQEKYEAIPSFTVSDNEVKVPLGWILDKVCNLRGVCNDKVGSYEGQALVLVAHEEATANDVIDFANLVAKKVKETTSINIEWEVTRLGF